MSNPEVAKWKDISWEQAVEEVKGVVGGEVLTAEEMMSYGVKTEWFPHGPAKDHGGDHGGRVFGLGIMLTKVLEAGANRAKLDLNINIEAVGWALVLHDIQANVQENGRKYRDHGLAAAEWIGENWQEVGMSEEIVELVMDLCQWHISDDKDVPEDKWTMELLILRNADSLDRVRFENGRRPEHALDESFLTFEVAKAWLVPIARKLFKLTELGEGREYDSVEEGFKAVVDAGVEMGLIRA